MTRALKIAATIACIAGAVAALRYYVALPHLCNDALRRATRRVERIVSVATDDFRAAQLARQSIDELRTCLRAEPCNVAAQMVIAASYRTLGRNREAASAYETALQYDRRPELYLNLGQTQLAIGDSSAALENLTLACIYNPVFLDQVGQYHPEVKKAVDEYQTRLMKPR